MLGTMPDERIRPHPNPAAATPVAIVRPPPWKALSSAFKHTDLGPTWYDFNAYRVLIFRPAPMRVLRVSRGDRVAVGTREPDVDVAALIREVRTAERIARGELPADTLKPGTYHQRRRATFALLLEHVHPDAQRLVADGWSGTTWPYLRLLHCSARARDIAGTPQGAAFANALAQSYTLTEGPQPSHWRKVERLLAMKRKHAMAALGFPAAPSSAALLDKIPRNALHRTTLLLLRDALAHPELGKRCFHAKRLTLPFLRMLTPAFLPHVGGSLLDDIALASDNYRPANHAAEDLRDVIAMAAQEGATLGTVTSLDQLRFMHAFYVMRAQEQKALRLGPLPPLPIALFEHERAWITPLLSFERLRQEGKLMHHCLGTLLIQTNAAADGRFYAFALHGDERATLAVWRPSSESPWRLYDVRGPHNEPVSEELQQLAQHFVGRFERARRGQPSNQLSLLR